MKNPKILIVDDDDKVRTQVKWAVAQQYEVILWDLAPSMMLARMKIKLFDPRIGAIRLL